MTIWWLGYIALGAFAGFFAGLLGIGGGSVMVPLLVMMFAAQGFPTGEVMRNSASAITNNDDVIASGSFKGLQ